MLGEGQVLNEMRASVRRGAYTEATGLADKLSSEQKSLPLIALEICRAFLRQGHPIKAESALRGVDLVLATQGERLILAIESASLRVYRNVAINEAIRMANQAFKKVEGVAIDRADRAEADRIYVRLMLIAATYYEVSPQAGGKARDQLPDIAEELNRAGRIDEALAARFTHAERLPTIPSRLEALEMVAGEAVKANRPHLAGEAHVVRAELLLGSGAPHADICEALDIACNLFEEINHQHGSIDVTRVKAKLSIEREFADRDALGDCLEAYRRVEFYRGMLNVLMDLSQLAHNQGDITIAHNYQRQMLELSKAVGMGLVRDSFQMAQIDLMIRNHDYGSAIELCQASIASEQPEMSKAGYEQLLATAYSFISDYDAACDQGRKAIKRLETIGAFDAASDAVMKLVSDLSAYRQEASWTEASSLLRVWLLKDLERHDYPAAINKREMIAQIQIFRFLYSSENRGKMPLLDEAEESIAEGDKLAKELAGMERAKRLGGLSQLRGQVYQLKGNTNGVIQTWQDALSIYKEFGLRMESANCHYFLGVVYLNRSQRELFPNFDESEKNLMEALTYFDSAGIRGQAADTRFMIAQLYVNTAKLLNQKAREQMLDSAIGHLSNGEVDYDAVRREFSTGGSVLEIQRRKRSLNEKSLRIYDLALQIICLVRPDPLEAWNWVQRAKARSLSDILGISVVPPERVMSELRSHPDSFSLVLQERDLMTRINTEKPEDRFSLRQALNRLWEQMGQDPQFSEYLQLRRGAALDTVELEAMGTDGSDRDRNFVCIDWFGVGNLLYLIVLRLGQAPKLIRLPLELSAVQTFVSNNLAPDTFRPNLRDTPELLRELDPLIAPLADLSHPEELLILSPTGPLHALPLHALEIAGKPLLARNPLVYCPSLSVLRHCLARRRNHDQVVTAALFGDPSGDRSQAANLVCNLAQLFKTRSLIQKQVTRQAFTEAIAGCHLVHFQGHAMHRPTDPLDSYLALADGNFTAREVFRLTNLRANLVTLAACESATSVIAKGDEPLGLIPAFLYAGANSVLATLWRVSDSSAARTMQIFYNLYTISSKSENKARALRQAMLEVRKMPGFESPYHWAPFVIYGDWL